GRVPTEKFDRTYDLELAIRPTGDARLELAGGIWVGEEEPNTPVDGHGRAILRPFSGVSLFGEYDSVSRPFNAANLASLQRDNRWLFGLTLDSDFVGVSYAALTSSRSPQTYAASSAMLRLSSERYPSLIVPDRIERIRLAGSPSDRQFVRLLEDL